MNHEVLINSQLYLFTNVNLIKMRNLQTTFTGTDYSAVILDIKRQSDGMTDQKKWLLMMLKMPTAADMTVTIKGSLYQSSLYPPMSDNMYLGHFNLGGYSDLQFVYADDFRYMDGVTDSKLTLAHLTMKFGSDFYNKLEVSTSNTNKPTSRIGFRCMLYSYTPNYIVVGGGKDVGNIVSPNYGFTPYLMIHITGSGYWRSYYQTMNAMDSNPSQATEPFYAIDKLYMHDNYQNQEFYGIGVPRYRDYKPYPVDGVKSHVAFFVIRNPDPI